MARTATARRRITSFSCCSPSGAAGCNIGSSCSRPCGEPHPICKRAPSTCMCSASGRNSAWPEASSKRGAAWFISGRRSGLAGRRAPEADRAIVTRLLHRPASFGARTAHRLPSCGSSLPLWRMAVRHLIVLLAASALVSCGGESGKAKDTAAAASPAATSVKADLTGAGATFPAIIYGKWFDEYATKTGVKINYQSLGSGAGVKQILERTVDFGASDAPMTDDELAKAKGGKVLHFPTVMGADVVVYNLPGSPKLKFTADVIADIFLGKITKWNDPRLVAINQGTTLPQTDILVVHRSDGSGTTYIWTDYLTMVNAAWAKAVGRGKDVQWPVGLGAKGNEGVAGQVKQTPGSIGYVELSYARQNRLAYGSVRNQAGAFVEPSIESVTAAAGGGAQGVAP